MIGENIKYLRKRAGYSQEQLARKLGVKQSSVSLWEKGKNNPDTETLAKAAQVFSVPLDFFLSDEPRRELDSIRINRAAIPILGNIACGQRVTPDTNPEGYADLPEGVTADFALRCKGDSMEPTFIDGDIVLIRRQPEVEAGQIAAVSIAGETTLKHVYRQKDGLLLVADNPSYSPIFAPANSDEQIIIHGLAVGYTRIFK
ncbi:MAG: helix-turn-helix domain-containing protein [Lentisphaeria bacterium]|nr:helix-turn-helix domain-containing protein [Lentisphaeria bacterium]